MSKQDRQGVRKASDLERKYDFSLLGKGASGDSAKVSQLEQALSQYMVDTNTKLQELESEVDEGLSTIGDVSSHITDKSNPHGVTKSQVGLGNVEDKSSETIRSEITNANVTNALGYTPISKTQLDAKVDKTVEYYGDINALVTSGFYRVGTNANLPTGYEYGQVIVSRGSDTATQICCSYSTGKIITRSCNNPDNNPNWTDWIDYATKKDLEDIDIGGVELSYEAENEALTLVSSSESKPAWNLLATKTGTTGTIALPTIFEELQITIGISNYMYTFNILASDLSSAALTFRNGYYISSTVYGDVYISLTRSQITAWCVRKEGTTQTSSIRVYYR